MTQLDPRLSGLAASIEAAAAVMESLDLAISARDLRGVFLRANRKLLRREGAQQRVAQRLDYEGRTVSAAWKENQREAEQRRQQIVDARDRDGRTFREIAVAHGISVARVCQLYQIQKRRLALLRDRACDSLSI